MRPNGILNYFQFIIQIDSALFPMFTVQCCCIPETRIYVFVTVRGYDKRGKRKGKKETRKKKHKI